MRYLRLLALSSVILFASIATQAEQRVIYVRFLWNDKPDTHQVDRLLRLGWRVIHMSTAGSGSGLYNHIVFVLESPASQPVKPSNP